MKFRVHYHHTDCAGVVYYAKYLEFLEEARADFLEGLGLSVQELMKRGVFFVVYRQEIDYKHPAAYGDVLDVRTWTRDCTGVRMDFHHEILNQNGRLISKAKTTMVCVNKELTPHAPPEDIAARLKSACA
ncbi:MAG: thioesterase family protein [Elusimicrobiota bacterium]|jgi:acyl-CoA thioester hydrolase